ncbi:MAG: NfeD family protein [Planctomycetota bacterium]|jgi:membrane-bound serine protease (ClpP class)
MKKSYLGLMILVFSFLISVAAASEGPEEAQEHLLGKTLVIPVKGMIAGGMQEMFEKEIERADKEGPRLIVLEIDSPGGFVDSVEPICAKLLQTKIPTVALVTKQAISGGSMIATACDEIVMLEGSTIGDCEPHSMIGSLPDNMREKIETKIRADMRANAQANNYPDKLLEAMVTKAFELYEIEFSDGKKELLYKNEIDLIEKQIKDREIKRKIKNRKIIVKEGSLLTLTAQEALEYKLAKSVVNSTSAFYSMREISGADIVKVKEKESGITMNVKLQMILVAFLIIGIAGLIVESQVPGFGVPGVVGIIGFAAFFATLFFYDRASEWEIALFVVGITLLIVEIFILPGFGVAGILGILCILGSLVLGIMSPFDQMMSWQDELRTVVDIVGYASIGAIVIGVLAAKYLPEMKIFKGLILHAELKSGEDVLSEVADSEKGRFPHEEKDAVKSDLVGVEGTAVTVLRPAGKMETNEGKVLDVVSSGVIIEEGKKVIIKDVNGPRIEVVELT